MAKLPLRHPVSLYHNAKADRSATYGAAQRRVLNLEAHDAALREIAAWPGYAPTPLVALPGLAAAAGIGRLWYKDEAGRFGLGSFKALGGAYAVLRLLADAVARRTGGPAPSAADLLGGRHRDIVSAITVTCATDGNHGRSVAWGARMFGCGCVIYIHATVSDGRRDAIAAYGARVVRTAGNYDDAVRQAGADAASNGWLVVSDTSYEGYMDVPRDVMQGYTVMVREAIEALPADERPTHVFIQAGVGGLAAAVCGHLWESWGADRPRLVVVEPDRAACLFESAKAGEPVAIHGDLDTIMAGLACGEVSRLAWIILERGTDDFLTITDEAAKDAMRRLADGTGGDRPLVAGESAVAGLAGLLGALDDGAAATALGLGPDSRVLLFGSEGDTDPDLYAAIIGRTADQVRTAR